MKTANPRLSKRLYTAANRGYKQSYFHTLGDLETIWRIQDGRCYYSGIALGDRFEDRKFHVDHLRPLVRRGSDDPLNLALTTRELNRRKADMTKDEFLEAIGATEEMKQRMELIDLGRRLYFKDLNRLKLKMSLTKRWSQLR